MTPRSLKLVLAAALAAVALTASAGVLVALNTGGAVSVGGWRLLQLAPGYNRASVAQMARRDGASLASAERLSRQAIALNPYDTGAWLRLASIDALVHGRLTPAGVAAFRRAYDLVAVDPYAATWRLGFAMEHWGELPPDVKAAVREEAMAVGAEYQHRPKVLDVLSRVRNPQARITASLWAARINADVPK